MLRVYAHISLRAGVDHLYLSWRVANTSSASSCSGSLGGSSGVGSSGEFSSEREGVIGLIPIVRVPNGFVSRRAHFVCPGGPRTAPLSHADDAATDAGATEAATETADDVGVVGAGSTGAGGSCGRSGLRLDQS